MRVVHDPGFLHLFKCPDCPLLLSSEALMLFLDPGETPVMATVVATVAPTFTCCPLGRRCISSRQWSSCLMWTSSCRGTTQDTQMTSNGETRTHADTHSHMRAPARRALLPHVISCSHICPPRLRFFPCWVHSVKPGNARCRGVKIICWFEPILKCLTPLTPPTHPPPSLPFHPH